jgi:hypothetical protein
MKQPEHCKYTPFEDYLWAVPDDLETLTLSFAEIEAILNSPLPKSARERLTWWNNEAGAGLSHKNAWLNAGWNVEAADLTGPGALCALSASIFTPSRGRWLAGEDRRAPWTPRPTK